MCRKMENNYCQHQRISHLKLLILNQSASDYTLHEQKTDWCCPLLFPNFTGKYPSQLKSVCTLTYLCAWNVITYCNCSMNLSIEKCGIFFRRCVAMCFSITSVWKEIKYCHFLSCQVDEVHEQFRILHKRNYWQC